MSRAKAVIPRKEWTEADQALALELRDQGLTYLQIAQAMGRAETTITRRITPGGMERAALENLHRRRMRDKGPLGVAYRAEQEARRKALEEAKQQAREHQEARRQQRRAFSHEAEEERALLRAREWFALPFTERQARIRAMQGDRPADFSF